MVELVPQTPRRPPEGPPDIARTLETLATALMLLVTIGILYFAREILIPIAIAVILSFVLSPLVRLLRSVGFNKKVAVGLVVLIAFLVAVGLGAILAKQVSDLAGGTSSYQDTVWRKLTDLRTFAADNALLGKLDAAIAKMDPSVVAKPKLGAAPTGAGARQPGPTQVEVVQPPPGVLRLLQGAAARVAAPLATAAFVAIFIVFILMQREDLRDRLIRLAGSRDLQRTTTALNDAARRLSRYFLAQVVLNAGFGVIVAVVLSLIGVPGAVLWGIVAAFMRFIPYVGSFGAALFPILLSLAASPGWEMAVETALFFAGLEIIVGYAVEPLVYGHNTGVSPIAVVLAATFWTWLWGPVGLVLATPLTVCVVVLGRHVERLAFLDVLLGDQPPLTEVESFYQRMLAGDTSEVLDHADDYLETHSLLAYCQIIAMNALLMAQHDVRRGVLTEERQLRIRDTMRDLAEELADHGETLVPTIDDSTAPASLESGRQSAGETIDKAANLAADPADDLPKGVALDADWTREGAVLCVAGRTPLDEAAAHLLADLLKQRGFGTRVQPPTSLTANHGSALAGLKPRMVILSFLDADLSIAQARFAVRRLRRRIPDAPLATAFWTEADDEGRVSGLCRDVHSDLCLSSLPEALALCLERGALDAPVGSAGSGELDAARQQRPSEVEEASV